MTTRGHLRARAAGHQVADFNTLDDLVRHAGRELGATYVVVNSSGTQAWIYFPCKDGSYEEARTWNKGGYWHAEGPGSRDTVQRPPRGAKPIEERRTPRTVRDYEAIDRRDRVIAGPFKSYGDAKDAAGSAGAVRFVPSRGRPSKATEARGSGRAAKGIEAKAQKAGVDYAYEQVQSAHFMDWVREQMLEASKAAPEDILPLETKSDSMKIAKNMFQQLEWDTRRELRGSEIKNLIGPGAEARPGDSEIRPALVAEFYDGFRSALVASRDWLADELLTLQQEIGGGGVGEARRTGGTKGGPPRKYYVVDQVQNGLWVQVGHFATKQAAEQFRAKLGGKTRIKHAFPSGHNHPPIAEATSRRPKAKRSVRRRR